MIINDTIKIRLFPQKAIRGIKAQAEKKNEAWRIE